MANQSVQLRDGYQSYFSFLTGFESQANIVSDVTVDRSFEGSARVVTFSDGSKIVIASKDPSPDWHIYVLNPSQVLVPVGDQQSTQCVVDLGSAPGVSPFDPNFLSFWLAGNNNIQPFQNEQIANQTLNGYGGDDTITGSLGNDRIIDDHGGLVHLEGGNHGEATGNDTFVFTAGVLAQGTGGRSIAISGTDGNFFDNYQAGEINTIEAQGNNDFSFADIHRINHIVFNGATSLIFGAGQFHDSGNDGFHSAILPSATIVGDAGANALLFYINPQDIGPGHVSGTADADLSQLVFSNWTAGQDTVTIIADQINGAGTPSIRAPNVSTTIIGGFNGEILTGGNANDTINGHGGNDTIDGGAGFDTAVFAGNRSAYTLTNLGNGHIQVVGPDGTDNVTNVERLTFDDQSISTIGTQFEAQHLELAAFGTNAGGWTSQNTYPREIADVNGDGRADIVAFGDGGTFVSLATGGGHFGSTVLQVASFGAGAAGGGWTSNDAFPREMADVNGDGKADIVGFGSNGVFVALSSGGGNFAAGTFELAAFGNSAAAGGWSSQDVDTRQLGDVNGDGMADIIGFGSAGVYIALATGNGHFGAGHFELNGFGSAANAGGWTSQNTYPREIADVNGDGLADIIAFGDGGTFVSLATGGGHFGSTALRLASFGAGATGGGWTSNDAFPREMADVNGDGKADIVGFGSSQVFTALGQADGTFANATAGLQDFGVSQGWTSNNLFPRELGDIDGNGNADIVGFFSDGVHISRGLDTLLV